MIELAGVMQSVGQAAIREALAELASGVIDPRRPPWSRPGWHAQAVAWIESQLVRLKLQLTEPVIQTKSWAVASILKVNTTHGAYYFKTAADLPLFVDEAAVTARLAARFPQNMPDVLAIDKERGWLLMAAFGPEIGWETPIETKVDVFTTFGRIQLAMAGQVEVLTEMGCIDRRLPTLAAQIDGLIEASTSHEVLPAADLDRLRRNAPLLKKRCAQLSEYNLPATLVHGDLHLSNVARSLHDPETLVFFDWTDACIAHPFTDMHTIFFEDDPKAREQLRDSYLALWLDYEPMGRLREAWRLALPLIALHQAISYKEILVNVEPSARRELMSGWPGFLRRVLDALALADG